MNDQDFANRVAGHLDESVEDLPPAVLQRLRAAREQALAQIPARQDERSGLGNPFRFHWKLAAPAFALIVVAAGYLVLNLSGDSPEQALYALEAEMLGHELPPHAFIDEGFEQWLKQNPKP